MLEVSFNLVGFEKKFEVKCEDMQEAESLRDYFLDNIINGTFTIWNGNNKIIRYITMNYEL